MKMNYENNPALFLIYTQSDILIFFSHNIFQSIVSGFSLYWVTQSLSSILGGIYGKAWHLARGTVVKNLPASAGDVGSILGSGRSPGEGNDYPLHYSCLENSMDRGAWRATAHGVSKNQTGLYDWARMQVYIYTYVYECLFFHW